MRASKNIFINVNIYHVKMNKSSTREGRVRNKPHCPKCKNILDGWHSMEDSEGPQTGDITVCLYCSAVLQYTDTLTLAYAQAENIAECDFMELQHTHKTAKRIQAKLVKGRKSK